MWYTIWRAEDDAFICCGDSSACAAYLGIGRRSFYELIGDERQRAKEGKQKYDILAEDLKEEEWALLDSWRESSLKL